MPKIFLSYRREDSAGYAGRIESDLSKAFGHASVFRDIEDIKPGVNFAMEIEQKLADCDVLIALIGPRWLTSMDSSGARRLEHPDDFVRIEIATALQRNTRVVPVLIQKVDMPATDALPEPLKSLALRQAVEVSDARWDYDVGQLIAALGGSGPKSSRRFLPMAFAAVLVLAAAAGAWLHQKRSADDTARTAPIASKATEPVKPGNGRALAAMAEDPRGSANVRGKWVGSWTGPQGKEFRILFNFDTLGDRLMGSVHYPTGEGGIQDGRIAGDRLLFITRHVPQFETAEVTISFSGKVSGNEIEFVMQRPNGSQRLIARRAASP